MNLMVTIIINNFNYAKYIGASIESALAQTYDNVEVIVSDDGSTDNSREVIESYRFIHCRGVQAQRRTSLSLKRRLQKKQWRSCYLSRCRRCPVAIVCGWGRSPLALRSNKTAFQFGCH